jgi:tetratricopeptide (TPR) repeat protein
MDNKEYGQAMICFINSLRIHEKTVGRKHAYTSSTLYNMGWLHKELGEFKIALELFFESYEIVNNIYGKDSPNIAAIGDSIARTYEQLGDFEKSDLWFKKTTQLCKQS